MASIIHWPAPNSRLQRRLFHLCRGVFPPNETLNGVWQLRCWERRCNCARVMQCNYGESTIPLDKWFGSFRDGQSAQDDKISSTPGGSKEATWVTACTCVVGSAIGLLPLVPLLKTAL